MPEQWSLLRCGNRSGMRNLRSTIKARADPDAEQMYRGACTDQTWSEDTAECPLFCTEGVAARVEIRRCLR